MINIFYRSKGFIFVLLISLIMIEQGYSQIFSEVSNKKNIVFKHKDGRTGNFHFTETLGSGIAWIDINNDDFIDLLLISGDENESSKLFLNKNGVFNDVTKEVKLSSNSRGMGVCSADINQDGWVDFLITNYGNDFLYLNNKGKDFRKKRLTSNDEKNQWSTSCAFADLDNDGDLDLYVTRYVEYHLNGNKSCQAKDAKGYCNPSQYPGQIDGLYINNGHGDFVEVGISRGLSTTKNDRGLGVVISDFDNDNDLDIYVANDGSANRLYVNDGKGYFKDKGLISGTAINQNGVAEASMGIGLGDVNNDGFQDLIVSHFSLETNTAYLNKGNIIFSDSSRKLKISKPSYMKMGWGIDIKDFNNDGLEDLVVANGHIHDFIKMTDTRQSYKQMNQIFMGQINKQLTLHEFAGLSLPPIIKSSRGLASADWNNDGKIDLAINNINDKLDLYKNIDANKNNWIGIKLIGNYVNSSAIGAVVKITSGKITQRKEVISGGSFMSQSDLRLVFGLKESKEPVYVSVIWPDGKRLVQKYVKLNRYHELKY